jgi:dGTPase
MAWLRRQDLEDRELRLLSRFAAKSRDLGLRRLAEADDPLRTAFQRDRDRIIHCASFRRMQHKTQVVAAYEGDHYRTRMTHSLEVAQMSRGTARALCLNPDLAEGIALGHDLGHPPYGHVGEEALDQLMRDDGGFRHNAQGLRIVDWLEDRYGNGFGLNLSIAVRRSLVKGTVPDGFPLGDDPRSECQAPVEAQVVDRCDRIAYLCHDLDDGLRARVFTVDDAAELGLWQRAASAVESKTTPRILSEMVALLIGDLVQATDQRWTDEPAAPPQVRHGADMTVLAQELLAFLRERFYRSRRVLSVMEEGQARIRTAFAHFEARPNQLPEPVQRRIATDGLRRTVCDYVAGMTDRFLLRLVPQ